MNKIVRFHRQQRGLSEPDREGGFFVSYTAMAIARAVIVNEIEPEELQAAIWLILDSECD